jgi:hypothetical protein
VHERWSRTRLASVASTWPLLGLEIQSLSGKAHLSEEGLFFSRYDPPLAAAPASTTPLVLGLQRRSCNEGFNVLHGLS